VGGIRSYEYGRRVSAVNTRATRTVANGTTAVGKRRLGVNGGRERNARQQRDKRGTQREDAVRCVCNAFA
jgi:hypothetical protein